MSRSGQSDMQLVLGALGQRSDASAVSALGIFRDITSAGNINSLAGQAGALYQQIQTASAMRELLHRADTPAAMQFMLAQQGLSLVSQVTTQVFSFICEQEKMRAHVTQQFNQLHMALIQSGLENDARFVDAIKELEQKYTKDLEDRSIKLFAGLLEVAGTEERRNKITDQWATIQTTFITSVTEAHKEAIVALKEANVSANARNQHHVTELTKQVQTFNDAVGKNPLEHAISAIKSIGEVVSSFGSKAKEAAANVPAIESPDSSAAPRSPR